MKNARLPLLISNLVAALLLSLVSAQAQNARLEPKPPTGPGNVVVTPKFGGTILGFDVDQNGTEGLLSESFAGSCGYATEPSTRKPARSLKSSTRAQGAATMM